MSKSYLLFIDSLSTVNSGKLVVGLGVNVDIVNQGIRQDEIAHDFFVGDFLFLRPLDNPFKA